MPLPVGNTAWPPRELDTVLPSMDEWSAWYSGSAALLERTYQRKRDAQTARPSDRPSTYRGGIVGAVARTFWGAPRGDLTAPKQKLHVPLAGDICQASADLLFSEPPAITADDTKTQERLAELVDDGMLSTLAEAAELTAALGGGYLRVTWDRAVRPDAPFLTAVDADGAWPEFRWGHLTAVTLWTVVASDGNKVIRHLERHELAGDNGVVLHGLYEGTRDSLGRTVPLNEDDSTAGLADQVVDGNRIDTASPGLAVVYIPNQRPQRIWRHDPVGRNLGRSDLQGVEGLMDALDETYTSWMRDIRLGKSRVFLAQSMLENMGAGKGAAWDMDQEIYAPLNMPPQSANQASGLPIQAEQFKIRYEEHAATTDKLIENILRTAGYSTQTFGMDAASDGAAATATEIRARQQRSYMTRDRKTRLWKPALADTIEKLLAVDAAVFNTQLTVERPQVVFPDGVQESQLALAQTALALSTAKAASTKTIVQMQHPDWPDEQVNTEVALIHAENSITAPPPDAGFAAEPAPLPE